MEKEAKIYPDTWVVIPVHSRREMTLACLKHLTETGVLQQVNAIVVDDGSNDGTADAVRGAYPEIVLLRGDGNLWWTGAITMGMKHAMSHGAKCVVWLNDDCRPAPGSFAELVRFAVEHKTAASGVTRNPDNNKSWYGGFEITIKGLKLINFDDHSTRPVRCEAMVGNFVAFDADCIRQCGFPEEKLFPHHCGDVSYTLKIARQHGPIYMLPQCGALDMQPVDGALRVSLLRSQTPVWPWLKNAFLGGPRSCMGAAFWHIHWRLLGPWGLFVASCKASRLIAIAALRVLLPQQVRRRIFA